MRITDRDMETSVRVIAAATTIHSLHAQDLWTPAKKPSRAVSDCRRQCLEALATHTHMTVTQIGDLLGVDHSAVSHSRRTHVDLMLSNTEYRDQYDTLLIRLGYRKPRRPRLGMMAACQPFSRVNSRMPEGMPA